jgi:hypothetical protein
MSKMSDQFSVPLPLEDASSACHTAIDDIGWKVKVSEPTRIVPTIGFGLTRNPSKIEVLLAEDGPMSSQVTLDGSIWGVGPIQKRHLQGEMTKLREAIETAVQAAPRPAPDAQPPASPAGDAEPPASPAGDAEPPASPAGDAEPPASPAAGEISPEPEQPEAPAS